MNNTTFLILFGIISILNFIVLFFTRRERKVIKEAEKVIGDDVDKASDVLDTFYGKLDEFVTGLNEISDKVKSEPDTQNPQPKQTISNSILQLSIHDPNKI